MTTRSTLTDLKAATPTSKPIRTDSGTERKTSASVAMVGDQNPKITT